MCIFVCLVIFQSLHDLSLITFANNIDFICLCRPRNWHAWANLRLFACKGKRWDKLVTAANRMLDLHEDTDLHKTGAIVDATALLQLIVNFTDEDVKKWTELEQFGDNVDVDNKKTTSVRDDNIHDLTDMKEAEAAGLSRQLPTLYWSVRLIRRSCNLDSSNPRVWAVLAEMENRMNRPQRVLECILKQCRATMVARWAENQNLFDRVAEVCLLSELFYCVNHSVVVWLAII